MNFEVEGPFSLGRHGPKQLILKESLRQLKEELNLHKEGLAEACGCYVFAIRAGRGYTPYYVGQACKSSICEEALNSTNREKYNSALSESKGTPVLFLVPLMTPARKYRKRPAGNGGLPELDFLERWLIARAIEKNPYLINNKETKFLRGIRVRGLFNAAKGEWTNASKLLSKTLS